MCLRWWNDGGKSVRIRGICGIRVLSFFDGSVILRMVVAWGLKRRRDIYNYIVINMWRRMDDQPRRTQRAQSVAVYLCVLCALCGFSNQLSGGC